MQTGQKVNRRSFLRTCSQTTGGIAAVTLLARVNKVLGANDRIRVAVVGIHGQGKQHIAEFHNQPGAEVIALCDVDENVLKERATQYGKLSGRSVKCYRDMRQVFDDKDVDAVSFATPNHWHALCGIWAMQAGKHAYIEKPCSHNIWEGRQLVKAARKYSRMCQHGTQARSCSAVREAVQKLREGVIGEVYLARGLCFKWRPSIGKTNGPQPVPARHRLQPMAWARSPTDRCCARNLHYDWHWQWDYGNGDMGNQGVHEMDLARWGLGVGLPTRIQAMGGHYMFDDDQQTPNTLICTFEYAQRRKDVAI